MPVKSFPISNSSCDAPGNIDDIRRKFDFRMKYGFCILNTNTSSDASEEKDAQYWGTDEDWSELNADAPTQEEFEGVIAFLRSTGRASK